MEHLVKMHSDHNPLLLRCCNALRSRQGRPFRFQAAWCTHHDYGRVVKKAWSQTDGDIVNALHNVSRDSLIFNKEIFGNILERKKQLEARLRGFQRALENVDSVNLLHLQKELLEEYETILFQEETMWFQKSREKWINLGSRNTFFFHAQIMIRRKRNKIHGIYLP